MNVVENSQLLNLQRCL